MQIGSSSAPRPSSGAVAPAGAPPAAAMPAVSRDLFASTVTRSPVAQAAAHFVATPYREGNQVELYVDGAEAYPRMNALIEGAKTRIDLEFFGVYPDEGGERVVDKLIAAAKRGVQVNLLVDRVASMALKNDALMARLTEAGVHVVPFTNGYKTPLLHAFQITDHRKILLVDGATGMTGGMNLGVSYEKYWHDFMVEVKGPTLADMYARFQENWALSQGAPLTPVTVETRAQGTHAAQFAVTTPKVHEIKDSMIAAFDAASKTIHINSPYFVEQAVVDALKRAASRGVEVTVLIPTVGDSTVIDYMNKMVTNELLAAGVKVYDYDTTNPEHPVHDHVTDKFNHGKVATVDGTWSSIGTANADTRSMNNNQECNVVVDSPEFARTLEQRIFAADLATRAKPARPHVFPWYSWPKQVFLKLARPFLFAF